MQFNIVSDIPLYYSPSFANEVERVITKNTDVGTSQIVQEIGIFISKLNQGIYNLVHQETCVYGDGYTYTIDEIGIVSFNKIKRMDGICILIDNIEWIFDSSYLFSNLTESAKKEIEAMLSLIERMDNLPKRPPII